MSPEVLVTKLLLIMFGSAAEPLPVVSGAKELRFIAEFKLVKYAMLLDILMCFN